MPVKLTLTDLSQAYPPLNLNGALIELVCFKSVSDKSSVNYKVEGLFE